MVQASKINCISHEGLATQHFNIHFMLYSIDRLHIVQVAALH